VSHGAVISISFSQLVNFVERVHEVRVEEGLRLFFERFEGRGLTLVGLRSGRVVGELPVGWLRNFGCFIITFKNKLTQKLTFPPVLSYSCQNLL